jgi:hypothetical protein
MTTAAEYTIQPPRYPFQPLCHIFIALEPCPLHRGQQSPQGL